MDRKRYNDGTFAPDTGRHIAANHVPLPLRALEDPGFDWAIRQVQLFARRAASKSPADGLPALALLRYHAERLERYAVINARKMGWSWREIGECLGVSKQVLQKRYAKIAPRLRSRYPRSHTRHGLAGA